ncbi:UNVERIFIED_CONTAM: hypothetical protein Sindi_1068400 [Sesamum indicum]
MLQNLMEDHQTQPTVKDHDTQPAESEASMPITEHQMWLATVVGKNKGCVIDLGSDAHVYSRTFTSPSSSPATLPQPNLAMEDRMNRLETMIVDMMVIMKEMHANSSTTLPSQPNVSISALAQPPINPLSPNDDDMNENNEKGLDIDFQFCN